MKKLFLLFSLLPSLNLFCSDIAASFSSSSSQFKTLKEDLTCTINIFRDFFVQNASTSVNNPGLVSYVRLQRLELVNDELAKSFLKSEFNRLIGDTVNWCTRIVDMNFQAFEDLYQKERVFRCNPLYDKWSSLNDSVKSVLQSNSNKLFEYILSGPFEYKDLDKFDIRVQELAKSLASKNIMVQEGKKTFHDNEQFEIFFEQYLLPKVAEIYAKSFDLEELVELEEFVSSNWDLFNFKFLVLTRMGNIPLQFIERVRSLCED